eukprot:5636350-Lingulodinium_polyedra.AAC.1
MQARVGSTLTWGLGLSARCRLRGVWFMARAWCVRGDGRRAISAWGMRGPCAVNASSACGECVVNVR